VKADFTLLRAALWSVCLYVGFGLLGFAVFAGFWPPLGEDLDATAIAQYFHTHGTAIRIGMVLMVIGAPCYYTWSVALSKIISRMEGPMGPLSMTELVGGLMTALVTAVPAVVWQTATFRLTTGSAKSGWRRRHQPSTGTDCCRFAESACTADVESPYSELAAEAATRSSSASCLIARSISGVITRYQRRKPLPGSRTRSLRSRRTVRI
jgi:hypothetical protein